MKAIVLAVFDLFKESGKGWTQDNASLLAAALAYHTIFALAPLLVIAVAVAGIVFGEAAVQGQIVAQIEDAVGRETAVVIQNLVANASQSGASVIATVLSTVLLLLAASGLFSQLQRTLNIIWGLTTAPEQGILNMLKKRSLAFGMVLIVGLLLLISQAISTIITAVGDQLSVWLPEVGHILPQINFLASLFILILLFALLFKMLPDAQLTWKDVLLGATVTTLLFLLGRYLIGLYLARSSATSTYGAAGSLVLILLWVYYSAQIFLFGAEFTQVYANKYGSKLEPAKNAVWRDSNGTGSYPAVVRSNKGSEETAVHKVTTFITRQHKGKQQLLLFRHPTAGIQIPAGTVEIGEDWQTAALREAKEETGLTQLTIQPALGKIDNELAADECVLTQDCQILSQPDSQAMPYQRLFRRGVTFKIGEENSLSPRRRGGRFQQVTYTEHDQQPNPQAIALHIQGWLPTNLLSRTKTRHYIHLHCHENTPDSWTLPSDNNHIFAPFWVNLVPKPAVISPQDRWLNDVYKQL